MSLSLGVGGPRGDLHCEESDWTLLSQGTVLKREGRAGRCGEWSGPFPAPGCHMTFQTIKLSLDEAEGTGCGMQQVGIIASVRLGSYSGGTPEEGPSGKDEPGGAVSG